MIGIKTSLGGGPWTWPEIHSWQHGLRAKQVLHLKRIGDKSSWWQDTKNHSFERVWPVARDKEAAPCPTILVILLFSDFLRNWRVAFRSKISLIFLASEREREYSSLARLHLQYSSLSDIAEYTCKVTLYIPVHSTRTYIYYRFTVKPDLHILVFTNFVPISTNIPEIERMHSFVYMSTISLPFQSRYRKITSEFP